jgi:hypothetical protein
VEYIRKGQNREASMIKYFQAICRVNIKLKPIVSKMYSASIIRVEIVREDFSAFIWRESIKSFVR